MKRIVHVPAFDIVVEDDGVASEHPYLPPIAEQPVAEQPVAEQPVAEQPVAEQPQDESTIKAIKMNHVAELGFRYSPTLADETDVKAYFEDDLELTPWHGTDQRSEMEWRMEKRHGSKR